ncbi:MAG: hypothetical protein M9894_33250 [Planctomycetes bacterium]|nr:hypothetical protein [Planctomycetota bacterium]
MRFDRLPVRRVRRIAIGVPLALACAVPCGWLLVAGDEVPAPRPPVRGAPGPAAEAPADAVHLTPARAAVGEGAGRPVAPKPVEVRDPWASDEVEALTRELLPLDRLAAQAALVQRFATTTDPRARAVLHQVDDRLALNAWARHQGRAADPADAQRPTEVVHALDPQALQARAHRARAARRRQAAAAR